MRIQRAALASKVAPPTLEAFVPQALLGLCGRRANPLRWTAPLAVADPRTAARERGLAFAMSTRVPRERAQREDLHPPERRDSAGALALLRQQAFPAKLALLPVLRALR